MSNKKYLLTLNFDLSIYKRFVLCYHIYTICCKNHNRYAMKVLNCPLFSGIRAEEVKKLYTCLRAKEVKFEQGVEICAYDSGKGVLGVVTSGEVVIKKIDPNGNSTILDHIQKNGVFSDVFAFTSTEVNFIGAYASEPTTVVFLDYPSVFKRCENACEYHSTFVENFLKIVIEKSKTLSQRVEILSNKTIREKILSYASIAVKNSGSLTFTLPMSLTSFAEYLCVDRSAMMRELKKLSSQGVLKTNKRVFTVDEKYI